MIVKLFGVLDLITAIMMLLVKWNIGKTFALVLALYIIIKSLVFIKDIASVIDLAAGVFFVLAIFNVYNVITYIMVVWLLQKSIASLFFI